MNEEEQNITEQLDEPFDEQTEDKDTYNLEELTLDDIKKVLTSLIYKFAQLESVVIRMAVELGFAEIVGNQVHILKQRRKIITDLRDI